MSQTAKADNADTVVQAAVGTKWALVTGAYSGIGFELSKLLAKDDYSFVLVARNEKRLGEAARELEQLGAPATYVVAADLAGSDAPQRIFAQTGRAGIHPEVLVNNAGFNVYGMFKDNPLDDELKMIEVNISALVQLTKLYMQDMVEKGRGRILNLGSIGSFVPGPLNIIYCATKAFVLSFSEGLENELRGSGVTVTALCPGATKTEFHERANMSDIKALDTSYETAESVARQGYRAMQRGQAVLITGRMNKLLAFFAKFMPRRQVAQMVRSFMERSGG